MTAPWSGLSPGDAAAWWLARERGRPLDRDEIESRDAWLNADPRNRAAHAAAALVVAQAGSLATPAMQAMLDAARTRAQRDPTVRRAAPGAIAASVALCLGVASLLALDATREDGVVMYRTALGERSAIALPDGSQLSLNTASRVRVAFTSDRRTVELLQGEALFDVAHDATRPFVVLAGDRRITAVGTSFDVRLPAAGEALHVTMLEGRVVVDPIPGNEQTSGGGERAEVKAGEQLVVAPAEPPRVQPANAARATAWRDGRLMFENAELAEMVREANRYSATKLVVQDAQLAKLKVSGVFRIGRPSAIADALSGYFPIDYREQGGQILLSPRR